MNETGYNLARADAPAHREMVLPTPRLKNLCRGESYKAKRPQLGADGRTVMRHTSSLPRCVRLRGLAPAAIEQGACRRHARGRWHGLLADDPREHPDAQLSVTARQRAQIGWNFLSGQMVTGWAYPLLFAACDAGDNQADLSMRPAGPAPVLHLDACTPSCGYAGSSVGSSWATCASDVAAGAASFSVLAFEGSTASGTHLSLNERISWSLNGFIR